MSDIQKVAERGRSRWLTVFTVLFIIAFFIFLILGLSQLFGIRSATRYVGGDAYNFLIQATKASASLIVAFGSFVSGVLLEFFNCWLAKKT